MDATRAPVRDPSVLAEAHDPLQRQAVSEAEAFPLPQPVASEVVALPVLAELAELVLAELEVANPAPQASRYSDSLFRQPRLISFFVLNLGLAGVVQHTQQKQGIQTHASRPVNGPFAFSFSRFERESLRDRERKNRSPDSVLLSVPVASERGSRFPGRIPR